MRLESGRTPAASDSHPMSILPIPLPPRKPLLRRTVSGVAEALNPLGWYWSWCRRRILRAWRRDAGGRWSAARVDPRLLRRPVPRWRRKRGWAPVDPKLLWQVRFGDRIWWWSEGWHPSNRRGGYVLVRKGRIVASCGFTPRVAPNVRRKRRRSSGRFAALRGDGRDACAQEGRLG